MRYPYPQTHVRCLDWARALCLLAVVAGLLTLCVYAVEKEDDTPPVVYSISANRITLLPGESVVVAADAEDDESGVQSVTVRFQGSTYGDILSVELRTNSDEDVELPYSGILKIPEHAAGTYQVISVAATDREENQIKYTRQGENQVSQEMKASFTVQAGTGVSSPATCRVEINRQGAFIKLQMSEEGTPADKVTLLFENQENHHKLTLSFDEDDKDGTVYGKQMDISPYEPTGLFILSQITVKDIAGNKTTYSLREHDDYMPLPVSASVSVQSSNCDTQAPVLQSVAIGQPAFEENKWQYPLTVQATDNLSGIHHITATFKNDETGDTASKVLWGNGAVESFAGALELEVGEHAPGVYRLDSVTLADYAGNRSTYCRPEDITERKLALPQDVSFTVQQA